MGSFIVMHTDTGAMDGVYFDRGFAEVMLKYWRQEVPGRWALLEGIDGAVSIPDALFAAEVFGQGHPAIGVPNGYAAALAHEQATAED